MAVAEGKVRISVTVPRRLLEQYREAGGTGEELSQALTAFLEFAARMTGRKQASR